MIIYLINILFSLILVGSNEKIDIANYLQEGLPGYNRIEYSIISPKKVNFGKCTIDSSRDLKVEGSYAYLPVKFFGNAQNSKNSLITLKLKLYKNVLQNNKTIDKRENLDPNYFNIVEKEVTSLRFQPVDVSAALINYRAKFRIAENSILQKSMIENIPDIRVGDRVTAVFNNNSVSVTFAVTARTSGEAGKIIKVKRDDKKLFKALVVNNTTVKIIE